MGLMKGGLPAIRRGPLAPGRTGRPREHVVSPVQILSANMFALGIILLIVGVDALLVPAYLIYRNFWYELAGALTTTAGAISLAWGLRTPESK